eukprot:scaffold29273_cov144-Amphora_coffeaeformis.AAC.1
MHCPPSQLSMTMNDEEEKNHHHPSSQRVRSVSSASSHSRSGRTTRGLLKNGSTRSDTWQKKSRQEDYCHKSIFSER